MHIDARIRDKSWWKGLVVSALLLAASAFFPVLSIAYGEVVGMVASYTYGFPVAEEAFRTAGVELTTLTNYEAVVEVALSTGYIRQEHVALLHEWRSNPSQWGV